MHRLTVDYTRYLRSPVVEVALFASERIRLKVGDTVLVNAETGFPRGVQPSSALTPARSSSASSTRSGRPSERSAHSSRCWRQAGGSTVWSGRPAGIRRVLCPWPARSLARERGEHRVLDVAAGQLR